MDVSDVRLSARWPGQAALISFIYKKSQEVATGLRKLLIG